MNTATDAQERQPKRPRSDTTAAPHSENPTAVSSQGKTSPKALALEMITVHVESFLPVLNPILSNTGRQFIDLLHRRHNKQRQFDRMSADDETIPRSARIEFQLLAPKNVLERPDFIELQDATSQLVNDFKVSLK